MNRGLSGILFLLLAAGAARADRYVVEPGTPGVTPGGGYTGWSCASTNIQLAVGEASAPETVWISNGTYYATGGTLVAVSKGITLRGFSGNPQDVKLDGRYPDLTNRLVTLSHGDAVLSSVTLRHGATTGDGGGAYVQNNALITNCVIVSNISLLKSESFGGGGVFLWSSSIRNSTISENSCPYAPNIAYGAAGGVCIRENALVQDCIVSNNITSKNGGGITFKKWGADTYDGVQILGCTITGNSVISNMSSGGGGGIWGDTKRCTLSNCVIRGNVATNSSHSGGGLLNVSAKIAGSVLICNNSSYAGGGAASSSIASDTPEDCVISNNTALTYGGGLERYAGRVQNVTLVDNVAGTYGGGIAFRGDASYTGKYDFVVSNCIVRGNQANGESSTYGGGGGIYFFYGGVVRECRIIGNTAAAQMGGGVRFYRNSVNNEVRNSLVADNVSSTNGGGISIAGGGEVLSSTLAGNSAGGRGGGVYAAGTTYFTNSVIAGNAAALAGHDVYHVTAANSNNYGYCCAPEGITPENQNLLADPEFADAGAGNYQLSAASPCRDTGLYDSWMDGMLDQAGRPRVDRLTGLVDMGCYEYLPAISLFILR